MTTYEPEQIQAWTLGDFTDLIGTEIALTVCDATRDGLVSNAFLSDNRIVTVEFEGDGSWTWATDVSEARITVHDSGAWDR